MAHSNKRVEFTDTKMKTSSALGAAWFGLVGYITIAEALLMKYKRTTMSTGFRECIYHPKKRWPVSLSWLLLTAHLFVNMKYDPIKLVGRMLAKKI